MARAYSMDLRRRVMEDVSAGLSAEAAGLKYSISARVIYQWKRLVAETGDVKPRQGLVGRKPKLTAYREEIAAAVAANSGMTLEELQTQLSLPGSISALWRALRSWNIVFKKSDQGHRTAAA